MEIVPKILEISWPETGWCVIYSQSDTRMLFTNADDTLHTGLHKLIVTDNNLKYDVASVAEIDHDRTSEFFGIFHT